MENLEKFNVTELSKTELVQIDGGSFWKIVDFITKAIGFQELINSFTDGWNSVDCGCPVEK